MWGWDFNPGDAVNEAHNVGTMQGSGTMVADVVQMLDPKSGGQATVTTLDEVPSRLPLPATMPARGVRTIESQHSGSLSPFRRSRFGGRFALCLKRVAVR